MKIINIERAILSTLIFEPSTLDDILDLDLKSSDFYHPFYKTVFEAIMKLKTTDKPIDEEFVKNVLVKNNQFDEVAFVDILSTTPISNPAIYIEQIKEHSKTRQIESVLLDARKQISEQDIDINPTIILANIKQKIEQIEQQQKIDTYPKINIFDTIFQEPENLDFILKGFEAGTIGILTGQGNTGKGFLSLMLSFAIADTTEKLNFLDLIVNRGKVGFLTAEDKESVLRYRVHNIGQYLYRAVGGDNSVISNINENLEIVSLYGTGIKIYEPNSKNNYTTSKWISYLTRFAENKKLVVIDTLRRFHTAEENSSGEMSETLNVFEKISKKTGTAFLLIHHTNKAGTKASDEQTSSRGSSAIIDNARYQIAMATMSKEQCVRYGIQEEDRKWYVQVDIPKANYTKPIPKKWVERIEGGVLEEVILEEAVEGKYNGRKKAK